MPRGDYAKGNMTVESVNSKSWKDRASELEEQLEQEVAEKESLQSRLDDIASIATPDLVEREERIDQALEEQGKVLLQVCEILGRVIRKLDIEASANLERMEP